MDARRALTLIRAEHARLAHIQPQRHRGGHAVTTPLGVVNYHPATDAARDAGAYAGTVSYDDAAAPGYRIHNGMDTLVPSRSFTPQATTYHTSMTRDDHGVTTRMTAIRAEFGWRCNGVKVTPMTVTTFATIHADGEVTVFTRADDQRHHRASNAELPTWAWPLLGELIARTPALQTDVTLRRAALRTLRPAWHARSDDGMFGGLAAHAITDLTARHGYAIRDTGGYHASANVTARAAPFTADGWRTAPHAAPAPAAPSVHTGEVTTAWYRWHVPTPEERAHTLARLFPQSFTRHEPCAPRVWHAPRPAGEPDDLEF